MNDKSTPPPVAPSTKKLSGSAGLVQDLSNKLAKQRKQLEVAAEWMSVRVRLATDELDALDRLTQLPHLDDESNTRGSKDDPRGASVEQVEEDDRLQRW